MICRNMKTAKKEETRKQYRREDLGVGVRGNTTKNTIKVQTSISLVRMWQRLFPMKTPSIPYCAA